MASTQVQCDASSVELLDQAQSGAQVTMNNNTVFPMVHERSVSWSGYPSGNAFPATLTPNSPISFTHVKGGIIGSKAAVVYTGKNALGADCSWVLAWEAPADTSTATPNKVYVACGSKTYIAGMSFGQIEMNLNNSVQASDSTNLPSKTKVDALIHELNANTATVFANYALI